MLHIAWSDVSEVVESVHLAMERMTPHPFVLAEYRNTSPKTADSKIGDRRDRESEIEKRGIQSALRFWPPK